MSSFFIWIILILCNLQNYLSQSENDTKYPLATKLDDKTDLNRNYANCFLIDNKNEIYYDLTNMKYKSDFEEIAQDGKTDFYFKTTNMTLYYNFCRDTNFKCNTSESLLTVNYRDNFCISYTKSKMTLKEWIYQGKNSSVLQLKMESEVMCTDYKNYTIYYEFKCDPDLDDGIFKLDSGMDSEDLDVVFSEYYSGHDFFDLCEKKINFVSKRACPQVLRYPMWRFYEENVHIFGMIFILFGFSILFYGNKFENLTTYVLAIVEIIYLNYCIVNLQKSSIFDNSNVLLWLMTIFQVLLGLCLGYSLNNSEKLKILFLGGFSGISIFSMLYYVFFGKLHFFTLWYYYGFALLLSIIFALLSLALFKKYFAIIFSSSICGSFLIFKGISMYAGGLPFEGYLIKLIEKKECVVLSQILQYVTITCYVVAWAVFAIFGFIFQYNQKLMADYVLKNKKIEGKRICLVR